MTIIEFPSVEDAQEDGLLCMGGDLEVASLKLAYESGIFPWPSPGMDLLWFAPPQRAILEFKDLKIPRRMARELRNKNFHFKINHNFEAVIKACSDGKTRRSPSTWIIPKMIKAYIAFHKAGFAHSYECYSQEEKLLGGLYGVKIGKMFAGESMFFHETSASKAALIFCIQTLQKQGTTWMDIQMLTPLLKRLGAKEIPRTTFMAMLKEALATGPQS